MKKQFLSNPYEDLEPGSPEFLQALRETGTPVHGIDETGRYSTANIGPATSVLGQWLWGRLMTWEKEQQADFVEEERMGIEGIRKNGGEPTFPFRLPETAPSEAKDYQELLIHIHFYRDWIKKGVARNAGFHAAQVKKLALLIQIRPLEPGMRQAETISKERDKLIEKMKKEKGERKKKALTLIAELEQSTTLGQTEIYDRVADEIDRTRRQVLRYVEEGERKKKALTLIAELSQSHPGAKNGWICEQVAKKMGLKDLRQVMQYLEEEAADGCESRKEQS